MITAAIPSQANPATRFGSCMADVEPTAVCPSPCGHLQTQPKRVHALAHGNRAWFIPSAALHWSASEHLCMRRSVPRAQGKESGPNL